MYKTLWHTGMSNIGAGSVSINRIFALISKLISRKKWLNGITVLHTIYIYIPKYTTWKRSSLKQTNNNKRTEHHGLVELFFGWWIKQAAMQLRKGSLTWGYVGTPNSFKDASKTSKNLYLPLASCKGFRVPRGMPKISWNTTPTVSTKCNHQQNDWLNWTFTDMNHMICKQIGVQLKQKTLWADMSKITLQPFATLLISWSWKTTIFLEAQNLWSSQHTHEPTKPFSFHCQTFGNPREDS